MTPEARLDELRVALAGADDVGEIAGIIRRLGGLASALAPDEPLYAEVITAGLRAKRKAGALLADGASIATVGKFTASRWQTLAFMSGTDFETARERAITAARRRRTVPSFNGGGTNENMLITGWHRGADGTLTRFVTAIDPGDDPVAIERQLVTEAGLIGRQAGRAA
jgi:hypothetical protein